METTIVDYTGFRGFGTCKPARQMLTAKVLRLGFRAINRVCPLSPNKEVLALLTETACWGSQ